ncbi:MAG: ABC transporter permease [Ignavibacteriota bacterium]
MRTLWKDRGFAAMAVLSLALGIGANTAIFSLVNGVLLRPLDFRDSQRLVSLAVSTADYHSGAPLPINLPQLVEWRKRSSSFQSIGAYRNSTFSLTGDGRPELIPGAQISANFFDVLGVKPRLGRSFLDQEDQYGQHREVIVSRFAVETEIRRRPGHHRAQDYSRRRTPHRDRGSSLPTLNSPKSPATWARV